MRCHDRRPDTADIQGRYRPDPATAWSAWVDLAPSPATVAALDASPLQIHTVSTPTGGQYQWRRRPAHAQPH